MNFTVAGLFGASVAFYRARLGLYLIMGAIFVALPTVISFLASPQPLSGAPLAVGPLVITVVSLVLTVWLQATVVVIAWQDAAGTQLSAGDAIRAGWGKMLPLLAVSVLYAVAVGIGFILLIVPGVILSLMWFVAVPAVVVGGAGIIESFSESRRLTQGHRVTLLLVLLLILAIAVAVALATGAMVVAAGTGDGGLGLSVLVNALFGAVSATFFPVMLTVTYIALKRLAGESPV